MSSRCLAATGLWDGKGESKGVRARSADDDAEAKRNAELALAIWDEAVDPRNTQAEVYLRGRGLSLPQRLLDAALPSEMPARP